MITVKDSKGHQFTTRTGYVMVIGNEDQSEISLPKQNGIRKTIMEEAEERYGQ